jgi:hypothetical protein
MDNNEFVITKGDVIVWGHPAGMKTIAVMDSEDWFMVALNFRGRADEKNRLWDEDNVHLEEYKDVRRADKSEFLEIAMELLDTRHQYKTITVDMVNHRIILERIINDTRFRDYIVELGELYRKNGTLKGMSKIREKYHVSGITKEQFFQFELHKIDLVLTPDYFFDDLKNKINSKK